MIRKYPLYPPGSNFSWKKWRNDGKTNGKTETRTDRARDTVDNVNSYLDNRNCQKI